MNGIKQRKKCLEHKFETFPVKMKIMEGAAEKNLPLQKSRQENKLSWKKTLIKFLSVWKVLRAMCKREMEFVFSFVLVEIEIKIIISFIIQTSSFVV